MSVATLFGLWFVTAAPQSGGSAGAIDATLDAVEAALRSAPPPEVAGGDRRIVGRVVTDDGVPLAGVRLTATPERVRSGWVERAAWERKQVVPRDALISSARSWIKSEWQRPTLEATSRADGTFEFGQLAEGMWYVAPHSGEFAFAPMDSMRARAVDVGSDEALEIVAIPLARQRFELRLEDGTTPESATLHFVRIGDGGTNWRSIWTPDAPTLQVPRGDWQVTAGQTHPGLSPDYSHGREWYASSSRLVQVDPTVAGETVVLELHGSPRIAGVIHLDRPRANLPISVSLQPLAPGERAELDAPRRGHAAHLELSDLDAVTWSFDSGRGRLEPGRFCLRVHDSSDPTRSFARGVLLTDGPRVLELEVATAPPPPLLVRVLDPEGRSPYDCSFELSSEVQRPNGPSYWQGPQRVERWRALDGRFALKRVPTGERRRLFASHPVLGRVGIELPPDARELELRFAPAALATVELAQWPRSPTSFAVELTVAPVGLDDLQAQTLRFNRWTLPGDGRLDLGALTPGRWRAELRLDPRPTGSSASVLVATADWELVARTNALRWPWPDLATLAIALAPEEKTRSFLLEPADAKRDAESRQIPWRRTVTANAAGQLVVPFVPTGRWRLREEHGTQRSMTLDVPLSASLPSPLPFADDPARVLRVELADPDGALARAGVRAGDVVVALHGREFQNRRELLEIRGALAHDTTAEAVTLTIRRGEQWLELAVPRQLLDDPVAAGGVFVESGD